MLMAALLSRHWGVSDSVFQLERTVSKASSLGFTHRNLLLVVVNISQVLNQKTNVANCVRSCHSSIACLEK